MMPFASMALLVCLCAYTTAQEDQSGRWVDLGSTIVKSMHDSGENASRDLVMRCVPLTCGLYRIDVLFPGAQRPVTSKLYKPNGATLDGTFEFRNDKNGVPAYYVFEEGEKVAYANGEEVEVARYSQGLLVWSKVYLPRPNGAPPELIRSTDTEKKAVNTAGHALDAPSRR